MLEYLLNYIDKLEKDSSSTLVIEMKKFILKDMLPYFIDNSIRDLKGHRPDNFLVQQQRRQWIKLCTRYEDYVDIEEIISYFDKRIQENYERMKGQRR